MQDELSRAHREAAAIREQWFEIFEDLEKEYAKKVSLLLAALKKLEGRSLRAERQRDEAWRKTQTCAGSCARQQLLWKKNRERR